MGKELAKIKGELDRANLELIFQNEEREKRVAELIIANRKLDFENKEKDKRAEELFIAEIERAFQNEEKEKLAAELIMANIELVYQKDLKEMRATELENAYDALVSQSKEKDKFAAELSIANIELEYLNEEKENRAAELAVANHELALQHKEKDLRAAELAMAVEKLGLQKKEKEKTAEDLVLANKELAFQNKEKEKRASELSIANKELVYQNQEKEKRAAELKIANKELAYQNKEKDKRSAELVIANIELAFQNEEKRKREEELITSNLELKKAEGQFRLLVESSPYAMVLLNGESFITLVNGKTEKLFGYERRELIGKKFGNLIQEQFRYPYYDLSHRFFSSPDFKNIGSNSELFFIRKDGSPFQVEIDLTPIETAEGHMVLISIFDITEKKIQEARSKSQMEQEIKYKSLEDFAYVASHDLQAPLKNISGLLQLFDEEYIDMLDENAKKILDMINSTIGRMSMLIKSLLEFSMIGHDSKTNSVDLNILIAEVISDLGVMVKSSDAVFKVQTLPTLPVYEFQMRRIFQNLITNALKFTKKEVQPEITISAIKVDKMWRFSVSDNGIGIESRHFEKVFTVFQRLNSKDAYEGSGVGLANCKKIAQLHQGDIWLESTVGQGTTFHFTIGELNVDK